MTQSEDRPSFFLRALRLLIGVWVTALVLLLLPYTADPASPIKYLATNWLLLAMVLAWSGALYFEQVKWRRPGPLFWILTAFMAVHIIAAALSPWPAFSFYTLRVWFSFYAIAFLASQAYTRPEQVWRLFAMAAGAVSVSSLYGFLQYTGLDPFPWSIREVEEYRNLPSTFANPNFAGHTLVMTVSMAFFLSIRVWTAKTVPASRGTRLLKFVFPALLLLMGLHLHMTLIRSGRLALMAAAGLLTGFAVLCRLIRHPLHAALTVAGVAVLAGAVAVTGVLAFTSIDRPGEPLPIDGSSILRINGYYGAVQMILDRPLTGYGPGAYRIENIRYWTPYEQRWFATEGKMNFHVHNDFLETAVDAGLPGAFFYLALLAFALLRSLAMAGQADPDRRRMGQALAACFTVFAVDNLFSFNLQVPVSGGLFFLLVGMLDAQDTGRTTSPLPRWMPLKAVAPALILAAISGVFFETRLFRAELLFQRGKGGQVWSNIYLSQGDLRREALALRDSSAFFEEGYRILPWDWRFPEAMGQSDLRLRRFDEAIDSFDRALAMHPYNSKLLVNQAQAYLNRALPYFERAGRAMPEPPFFEDMEKAGSLAQAALKWCPVYPEGHEVLGRIVFLRAAAMRVAGRDNPEDWALAARAFESALRYGAVNKATALRMLAQCHLHLGEPDLAESALRRATESDPTDIESWELFQRLAAGHNREEAFISALSRQLGQMKLRDPVPLDAVGRVATFLASEYMRTDPDLARTIVGETLALDPTRLDTWGVYAALLPPNERLAGVQRSLHSAGEALRAVDVENNLPPLLNLVRYFNPNDVADAAKRAETLASAAQERTQSGTREMIRREMGWIAALFHDAIGAGPLDELRAKALLQLAFVYGAAGQWEPANEALRQAVPALKDNDLIQAMLSRTEVLATLKRPAEALEQARETARLAPRSAAVRWSLAKRLAEAGRHAEARFEYMSLLQEVMPGTATEQKMREELDALESPSGSGGSS